MSKPTRLNPEISGFGRVGFFCFIETPFSKGWYGMMECKCKHCWIVSGLMLALAAGAFAQESTSASTDDYRALKQEVDELKQHIAAQDEKLAETTTPTTQPSSTKAATGESRSIFSSGDNAKAAVKSLFAARTEKEYFSPFDIMNPEHIRADMPMEIGGWKDMNLYMGLQTVGRFQAIRQGDVSVAGVAQPALDAGFQDPFANLSFLAQIPDKLDVYFDLYIASRPHASTMYGHEGYMLFKQLPAPFDKGAVGKIFDYVNVKVGAFDLDFGDDNYRRSNNARVQRNPLIGNPLIDPNVEEIGGEVYTINGPVYGLFGAGSGTTTEHFDAGSQLSFHGKLWAYPIPEVRTSISAYHVDLAGSADTSYLFVNGRSGGTFASVFGGGDNPGQILPNGGKDVTAVQGDVTWNHWPFETYANLGWTQDSDINGPAPGSPAERWLYGTFEPVYHITPSLYVAGRYSFGAAGAVNGVSTDGWVDRAEVGGGYWVTNNLLGKLEYVYERYHGFTAADGTVRGVDAVRSPHFNGVVLEVSFAF